MKTLKPFDFTKASAYDDYRKAIKKATRGRRAARKMKRAEF